VVQVWSTSPQAVSQTKLHLKRVPHVGTGAYVGLEKEIHVTEIKKYIEPVQKLLAGTGQETKTLSPAGASIINFTRKRQEVQRALMASQYDMACKKYEASELSDQLREQRSNLQKQVQLIDTYVHGTSHVARLTKGAPAPVDMRWKVYQNRQFLNREIGLLANLMDLDFREIEDLDKWLVESGQIWKFLPFEKTLLVTRIRDDRKRYGDPLVDFVLNQYNFQNILWIRNGQNVSRVDVEFDFENAVFPDANQETATIAYVEDEIWKDRFKPRDRNRPSTKLEREDAVLGLKPRAWLKEEPYGLRKLKSEFETLERFTSSDVYRKQIHPVIREKVYEYMRDQNKEQMTFLLLLQGIVDHTKLLDIPAGTDLFRVETCQKHFDLLYDYTHGLPDRTYQKQMLQYTTGLQAGDWVIMPWLKERDAYRYEWSSRPTSRPTLYRVLRVTEFSKEGAPTVWQIKHQPKSKRWPYERRRTPVRATVKQEPYLKVTLPSLLAGRILDDREWKQENTWMVPVLARWKEVQKKYLVNKVNDTFISFGKEDDD
jgi:hypothetical protein